MRLLICLLAVLPALASAQGVLREDYDILRERLGGLVSFETLPRRDEPGLNLQSPMRGAGLWVGEHFAGQAILPRLAGLGVPHDALVREPAHRPLTIRPGPRDQNIAIAFHRGFGSNAVFPLGPRGFHDISGRGEGALAVVFDSDQNALGFRLHAAYDEPLNTSPQPGQVEVLFFTRGGNRIARAVLRPETGVQSYGFRREANRSDIAGIIITNTDPGGIALDDILFQIDLYLF